MRTIMLTDIDGIEFKVDINMISTIRDKKSFREILFHSGTPAAKVKEEVGVIIRLIKEAKDDNTI